MALDLSGGKQKADQQFREEIRMLATQIETVNQQLASGGSGSSGGPAMTKSFADFNSKLQFLYEFMKTFQTELKGETKASFEQVQKSVTHTLQKNLDDVYSSQKETAKAVKDMEKRIAGAPAFNTQDLVDIKMTLKNLVTIYREEVEVFKKQNEFLQNKLMDIEKKLK